MPDAARLLQWTVVADDDFDSNLNYQLIALDLVTNMIVSNVGNSIGGGYDDAMMEDLATEIDIVLE